MHSRRLFLALVVFVTILAREILRTMADYDGDLKEHVRTVATVWSKRARRHIVPVNRCAGHCRYVLLPLFSRPI